VLESAETGENHGTRKSKACYCISMSSSWYVPGKRSEIPGDCRSPTMSGFFILGTEASLTTGMMDSSNCSLSLTYQYRRVGKEFYLNLWPE
jgi:hypothetical protein